MRPLTYGCERARFRPPARPQRDLVTARVRVSECSELNLRFTRDRSDVKGTLSVARSEVEVGGKTPDAQEAKLVKLFAFPRHHESPRFVHLCLNIYQSLQTDRTTRGGMHTTLASALQRARLTGTQFFYRFGMYVSSRSLSPPTVFNHLQPLRNPSDSPHPRLLGRHHIPLVPRYRQLLLISDPVLRRLHPPCARLLPHSRRHLKLLRAARPATPMGGRCGLARQGRLRCPGEMRDGGYSA